MWGKTTDVPCMYGVQVRVVKGVYVRTCRSEYWYFTYLPMCMSMSNQTMCMYERGLLELGVL